jgi:phosphoribosylformylglycinamidine synthase PurS subunit
VPRVIVDVMPKAEILDPQGQAIAGALPRLGFAGVSEVRQGKRFELEVAEDVDDATLEQIAQTLLCNTVIEEWTVRRVSDGESATVARAHR